MRKPTIEERLVAREEERRRASTLELDHAAELTRREMLWGASLRVPVDESWNLAAVRVAPELVALLEDSTDSLKALDELLAQARVGARSFFAEVGAIVSANAATSWRFTALGHPCMATRYPGGYLLHLQPVPTPEVT